MNITLVTETFPPEINGVAMTFGHVVAGLTSRGHHVTVLRPRQKQETLRTTNPTGITHTEHLFRGLPIPGYPLLRLGLPAAGQLRRLWTDRRPDIVHLATEGPLGWSALRVAKKLGISVSSSFHTNFHAYGRHYGFGFLRQTALGYLRWFHNQTRCTFAPTEELCRELEGFGFQRLAVLSRGVATSIFSPALRSAELRAQWGARPDDPVVFYAGRMAPEKNLHFLFKIFEAMRAANPRCRFVLVGDGPLRKTLSKQHDFALFMPFQQTSELARHYASSDIYIHASLSETFGNVLTEAMSSGLAVAGFDYAAGRLFIQNKHDGLTVACDRPDDLLAAAVQLATDESLRTRLRNQAPNSVKNHSWEKIVERFEAGLRDVVNVPPHP